MRKDSERALTIYLYDASREGLQLPQWDQLSEAQKTQFEKIHDIIMDIMEC